MTLDPFDETTRAAVCAPDPTLLAFEREARASRLALKVDVRLAVERQRRQRLATRLAQLTVPFAIAHAWCSACHGVAGVEGHNRRCADSGERSYKATPWPMAVPGAWVA